MASKWKGLRNKLLLRKKPSGSGWCGIPWSSRRSSLQMYGEEEIAAGRSEAAEERRAHAKPSAPLPERGGMSLMSCLQEEEDEEEEAVGLGENCCVCMGRKKGAAFIPCGHAFCRVCARQLWIERPSCALCNRPILEILDVF